MKLMSRVSPGKKFLIILLSHHFKEIKVVLEGRSMDVSQLIDDLLNAQHQ